MLSRIVVAVAGVALLTGVACSSSDASASPLRMRLGYFANLTHAPAILGVANGVFAHHLGPYVKLDASIFTAGPAAVEALFANSIDAAFVGPNSAINAFTQSDGQAIRIVAGSTSGGAALVVNPSIGSAADLLGRTLATPQLGNTQDIALRSWLKSQGLKTDMQGGGDVFITPQDNAQTLETFKAGTIDGAWVPEPWASRLQIEGGGKVLVDESTLWPGGTYATTELIVRTAYLNAHRDLVRKLVEGEVEAVNLLNSNPTVAQTVVNAALKDLTGRSLTPAVLTTAWAHLTFTVDPLISTLQHSADNALAVGTLKDANLSGIADLSILNGVLRSQGKREVAP